MPEMDVALTRSASFSRRISASSKNRYLPVPRLDRLHPRRQKAEGAARGRGHIRELSMWYELAPRCFSVTPAPQSHPSGIHLRDGHLEKSPFFAVTTLELVLQKLLAEGLKSPMHSTRMGPKIFFPEGFKSYSVWSSICLGPMETSL